VHFRAILNQLHGYRNFNARGFEAIPFAIIGGSESSIFLIQDIAQEFLFDEAEKYYP